MDLILGLPKQTLEGFGRTLDSVIECEPDRIALYAYAHLPERFKPQRRIADADLPAAGQRVAMLGDAIAGFLARDYCYIGMDHFALPDDALAVARREGRLHRNFQGYSTQPDCDLVALGVSAIGRIGPTYYQNAKTLPEYFEALQQGRLPVVRGYALTADDLVRRRRDRHHDRPLFRARLFKRGELAAQQCRGHEVAGAPSQPPCDQLFRAFEIDQPHIFARPDQDVAICSLQR